MRGKWKEAPTATRFTEENGGETEGKLSGGVPRLAARERDGRAALDRDDALPRHHLEHPCLEEGLPVEAVVKD
ncbi:hypothetical protein NDU88_003477 [Pleurodeles waltl]|uniref:Uncharacterized protein n=1 Tax=Pleurodeles waltl TaxID=8319 RepID=A0AAV7M5F2_PLEWA|nr:hypothetical protein NDU88_003477 [Pleurodeles waltl]